MQLRLIHIAHLTVSAANMRGKQKADIANSLPSVSARSILVPMLVSPNGSADTFEIVAGKRRYCVALAVAEVIRAAVVERLLTAVSEDGAQA